jgi:hypothetical protein
MRANASLRAIQTAAHEASAAFVIEPGVIELGIAVTVWRKWEISRRAPWRLVNVRAWSLDDGKPSTVQFIIELRFKFDRAPRRRSIFHP